MSDLDPLSMQWNDLVQQLAQLGPMHPGSICQQTNRVKAKDGTDILRGPYTILTFKRKGKTVTRHLANSEDIERSRLLIDNFRRFQSIVGQLSDIGQQRAMAEPVAGKKNSRKQSGSSKKPKRTD